MYKTINIELYISIYLCTSYFYLKKENPNLSLFMCDKNQTHKIWSYEWNECKMTVISQLSVSPCSFKVDLFIQYLLAARLKLLFWTDVVIQYMFCTDFLNCSLK